MDFGQMGREREQPQGALLLAHREGPGATGGQGQRVAAPDTCDEFDSGRKARAAGRGGMSMFAHKRTEKDFAEEIKAHLEWEADELRGEGVSDETARLKARQAFGNVSVARERFYLRSRWEGLDRLVRDLKHSLRSLLHSPGFTITAILTLALGMGANTAVFSVMNAVMLQSLPVADAN